MRGRRKVSIGCEWISICLSPLLCLSVCCLYYSRLMGAEVIVLEVNWAENEVVLGGGGWWWWVD